MIPRLKPNFGFEELMTLFRYGKVTLEDFETAFAKKFGVKYAAAFPYGRVGLLGLFKGLGFINKEIILPAYTCVVVAHAIVLSGNIPRFIDSKLPDFNMNLDLVDQAINENTTAILATHIFGYPLNMNYLYEIVGKYEKKYGRKIYIINDCAHSFGTKSNDQPVYKMGDAAIFALNISKLISSIFGGIVTTDHFNIYQKLVSERNKICTQPTMVKQIKRVLYFLSTYLTFKNTFYDIVNYIETNTCFINRFTKYYDESAIDFPSDWMEMIGKIEAAVGIEQLKKYEEIISIRIKNAKYYEKNLKGKSSHAIQLPPIVDGATYSHYVPLVKDRDQIIQVMRKKGVQIGNLIEYSIPYMKAYHRYKLGEYPVSKMCSEQAINLPIYKGVKKEEVVKCFLEL